MLETDPRTDALTPARRTMHPRLRTTRAMPEADTIKDITVEVKRCAECGARFGIDAAFCPFDGVALSTSTWDKAGDPRAHLRVDGRYEVLEPLGEGGMGTVYKVRHVTLDRLFAMKVLRRDLATDVDLAQRFVHEARATAAVKHPSVVAITDFGDMEDGVPYFVMELLEGETLATRIRARGPIPPRTALAIAKQVADALAASHAANVIHRDLKPDNVFLVGKRALEDEIRIVDFGAAKIVGGSKLTRPGIVFGTPYYMSPEQASGQTIDGRADVYSLGVLLFEMVTGRVPFEADTYMGVLTKHLFQTPPRMVAPSGIQLGELEAIVMRALEKDPAARYASMEAFARVLDQAASGRPQPTARFEPAARTTVKLGTMTTADRIELSVGRRVAADARRKRLFVIGAASACATLAAGAALVALWTSRTSASASAIASPPADSIAAAARLETSPPAASSAVTTAPAHASAMAPRESAEPSTPSSATAPAAANVAPAVASSAPAAANVGIAAGNVGTAAGSSAPAAANVAPAAANVAPAAASVQGKARLPAAASSTAPSPAPLAKPATSARPAARADDFPDPWKR